MAKVSKQSAAHIEDAGPAEDRHEDISGYTVNFVSVRADADQAPLLKGLPGDRCQCPHWGYVFKGKMTVRYADGEEICEAGDAFYLPPGHTPAAVAGTEFVQFSPSEALLVVLAAMKRNARQMHAASEDDSQLRESSTAVGRK